MQEKTVFKKVIDFEEAQNLLEQMRLYRGFPSGYGELDQLCGGLVRDGVTLIAARPAMGTTTLAWNIVHRLSRQQEGTILIFSPNERPEAITMGILNIAMDVPSRDFLDNQVPPATLVNKFRDYYGAKKANIRVDSTTALTLDHVWRHCCNIPDLRMVVIDSVSSVCKPIDHLGKIEEWGEPENPHRVFSFLQKLAYNLNVPVVCTTHVHRSLENRKNKRPRLRDLTKSGIAAEWIDQILFLYRDRYYDPHGEEGAELIAAKVAQGNVGTVLLDFHSETRRFEERICENVSCP